MKRIVLITAVCMSVIWAFAEATVTIPLRYGYNISNSYSPGYCGWDVSEQRLLFSLLPQGFCGVQLLPSCLMLPLKSVSTVVAIGPDVTYEPYRCNICRKRDCYRRH